MEDAAVLSRLHYPQRISQTQKQKEPGTRTAVLQIIYDIQFNSSSTSDADRTL